MKKLCFTIVVALVAGVCAFAQGGIKIYGIDPSAYPEISTEIRIPHEAGLSDMEITEDGIARIPRSLDCPEGQSFFSLLILIDRSGSMEDDSADGRRIDRIVVESVSKLIDSIPETRAEISIIIFSSVTQVKHEWTDNKESLKDSLNSIIFMGFQRYLPAFFDPEEGAFRFISEAKYRPAILLVTDGGQNNYPIDPDKIIHSADSLGVPIYTMIIGDNFQQEVSDTLRLISEGTYGKFKHCNTQVCVDESFTEIVEEIADNYYPTPCTMTWLTDCNGGGKVEITYNGPETSSSTFDYRIPENIKPKAVLAEDEFELYSGGEDMSAEIVVSAQSNSMTIDEVNITDNLNIFEFENLQLPAELAEGSSVSFTIRFSPESGTCSETDVEFRGSFCNEIGVRLKSGIVNNRKFIFEDTVLVGEYKRQVFPNFIENQTCRPLSINELNFAGPDAAAFSFPGIWLPINLEPGESEFVTMDFTPTRSGLHQAQLQIVTDLMTLYSEIIAYGTTINKVGEMPAVSMFSATVYPNPARESVFIELENGAPAGKIKISLYDSMGILRREYDRKSLRNNIELPLQGMPAGIYFLRIESGSECIAAPIVLNKK